MSVNNILTENNYTGYFENLNVDGQLVVNEIVIDNIDLDNLTINDGIEMASTSTLNFDAGSSVTGDANINADVTVASLSHLNVDCDVILGLNKQIFFGGPPFGYELATYTCQVYFSTAPSTSLGPINILLVKAGRSVSMFVPSISFNPNAGPGTYNIDMSAIVGTKFEPGEDRGWICIIFTSSSSAAPGILSLASSGIITIYAGLMSTILFPGAGTAQGLTGGTSFVYRSLV